MHRKLALVAALMLAGIAPAIAQQAPVAAAKGADVAVEELNVVWAKPGLDLSATIYKPKSAKPLPC